MFTKERYICDGLVMRDVTSGIKINLLEVEKYLWRRIQLLCYYCHYGWNNSMESRIVGVVGDGSQSSFLHIFFYCYSL